MKIFLLFQNDWDHDHMNFEHAFSTREALLEYTRSRDYIRLSDNEWVAKPGEYCIREVELRG